MPLKLVSGDPKLFNPNNNMVKKAELIFDERYILVTQCPKCAECFWFTQRQIPTVGSFWNKCDICNRKTKVVMVMTREDKQGESA